MFPLPTCGGGNEEQHIKLIVLGTPVDMSRGGSGLLGC